jgi:hypothetical protein
MKNITLEAVSVEQRTGAAASGKVKVQPECLSSDYPIDGGDLITQTLRDRISANLGLVTASS